MNVADEQSEHFVFEIFQAARRSIGKIGIAELECELWNYVSEVPCEGVAKDLVVAIRTMFDIAPDEGVRTHRIVKKRLSRPELFLRRITYVYSRSGIVARGDKKAGVIVNLFYQNALHWDRFLIFIDIVCYSVLVRHGHFRGKRSQDMEVILVV